MKAIGGVQLVGNTAGAPSRELPEDAESGLGQRHAEDVSRHEGAVGEFVQRAVVRQVELA